MGIPFNNVIAMLNWALACTGVVINACTGGFLTM